MTKNCISSQPDLTEYERCDQCCKNINYHCLHAENSTMSSTVSLALENIFYFFPGKRSLLCLCQCVCVCVRILADI